MFSNASFSASNLSTHLLLCPWSYTVGKAPSETSKTEGLSHCEIPWFFPAHTWLCLRYTTLHNCVLVWINVGRWRYPASDMIRVLVTQFPWCPDRETHPRYTDCCISASSGRLCWALHEQRQVLNCRGGQDKIWTRLQSISALLPCQNAIHNKTENWIYVFMPNSLPTRLV